ncbi:MAG TPA: hypothetical protein DCG12_06185 [Planctomycetaceae bacterium]|nr:hypothetical protein [Planctomycetaceae bacterium]
MAALQEGAVRLLQAAETDTEQIEILRSLTDVPACHFRRECPAETPVCRWKTAILQTRPISQNFSNWHAGCKS